MTETDNVDGPESYVDEEKNRLCVTWQLRIGSSRLFSAAHPSGPKGRCQKKKRENVGILKKQGGGLPKSHFFCNLTKCFLACQIHSEVLKHVLQ